MSWLMWTGDMMNIEKQNIIPTFAPDYSNYLSAKEKQAIDHEISIVETKEAAGIEALKVVQEERGWISDESLAAIAEYLSISEAQLEGVATFYNLIYRRPVGRHVIHLCDSISCHLCGYDELYQTISKELNISYGGTTDDGSFTLLSNACLGCCDKSPAMLVGKHLYTQLTPEKAVAVINQIRAGEVNREVSDYDCP